VRLEGRRVVVARRELREAEVHAHGRAQDARALEVRLRELRSAVEQVELPRS
jgi:hypothetical protein